MKDYIFVGKGMKNRCNNPNYLSIKIMVGRGIKVCEGMVRTMRTFKKFMLEKGI